MWKKSLVFYITGEAFRYATVGEIPIGVLILY